MKTFSATWRSPAKVNLCLRVTGRRDDGYHELDSIFVPIDLCDRIAVRVAQLRIGGETSVTVRCGHPGVPEDDDNLAARAVHVLLAETGHGAEVACTIEKTIPPGAGLGGGSSNAATVLAGLNDLLELGVPAARLRELALHLGADVPFFLCGGPARVRGIGEAVQRIAGWPDLALVVAMPPLVLSTRDVFRRFAEVVGARPPEGSVREAPEEPARLAAGARPDRALLVNDLERVVLPAYDLVAATKERLLAAGAIAAVMSGSGSSVVGLAGSPAAAEAIATTVSRESPESRAVAVGVFAPEHAIGQ